MNAAAYARFSSENQRTESIDAQLRAIDKYALDNNITITDVYTDYALSGRTDQRPQFQKMIRDAKANLFDAVIVHKLDRFSRDMFDWMLYERELKSAGVRLVSVVEDVDDSATGRLVINMKGVINQWYSMNLGEEVRKGLTENAYKGRHTGGQPPWGYDLAPDKTYIINEREASGVRLMFDMYASGSAYREIAETLYNQGYRSKRGNPIQHTAIREMLCNEKYTGVFVWNRRKGSKNSHLEKDPADIIRVPGGIPRIVDDKTWDDVRSVSSLVGMLQTALRGFTF